MILISYIRPERGIVMDCMIRWKLKEVLDKHGITPYRLMVDSGLANTTIYRLTNSKTASVQGPVLDKVLNSLCKLTGKRIGVGDVLEHIPANNKGGK
jgi:DNA-binding Xre family transcriptional regulator